jgi:ABC-type Zn2+ transport system substrate-binding protein/surface adhesin
MKGGMMDKKLEDGYEMLEISKGLWVEAIFAKKKELIIEKPRFQSLESLEEKRRKEEDEDELDDEDDEDLEDEKDDNKDDEDEEEDDETYYGSFTPEAAPKGDMTLEDLSDDL